MLARLLFQHLLEHVVSQGTWAVRFQPCFERLVVGDVQRLADDCCVRVSEAERSSNQLKNSRCVSSVHQCDSLKLKNTTISERNYPISFFRVSFCLPVRSHGVGVLRSCLPASLCRAPIHGPSSEPTDTKGHTHCVSRALMPTLAVLPRHVCHRRETGLSPLARTCSRTWVCPRRLHIKAHRVLCLIAFTSENHDPKNWR